MKHPLRWDFPASTESPLHARRLVTEWLGESSNALPSAHVLVSEVVTNVVRHARSSGEMRLQRHGDVLRVEVEDRSEHPPRLTDGSGTHGGYGMRLVDALATRWGSELTERGKVVWFELEAPDAASGPEASADAGGNGTGRSPAG